MVGQVVDALAEDGYLYFRGARVGLVLLVRADDVGLAFFRECHVHYLHVRPSRRIGDNPHQPAVVGDHSGHRIDDFTLVTTQNPKRARSGHVSGFSASAAGRGQAEGPRERGRGAKRAHAHPRPSRASPRRCPSRSQSRGHHPGERETTPAAPHTSGSRTTFPCRTCAAPLSVKTAAGRCGSRRSTGTIRDTASTGSRSSSSSVTAVREIEIPTARPAQRLEMGAAAKRDAQIVRERSDVEAGRTRRRGGAAVSPSTRSSVRSCTVTATGAGARAARCGPARTRALRRSSWPSRPAASAETIRETCPARPGRRATARRVSRGRRVRRRRAPGGRSRRVVSVGCPAQTDDTRRRLSRGSRGIARAAWRGRQPAAARQWRTDRACRCGRCA